jgi:hypothetical protein
VYDSTGTTFLYATTWSNDEIKYLPFKAISTSHVFRIVTRTDINSQYSFIDNISVKEMSGWTEVADNIVKAHPSSKVWIKNTTATNGYAHNNHIFDTLR